MKHIITFLLIFCLNSILLAQESSVIRTNNLEHPQNYIGVPIGELGNVMSYGHGKTKLVLIVGMGFNRSVFYDFMMRNKEKYEMYVFTPAGYGGTIAPAMPESDEISLSERTWSKAFENSVTKYIDENLGNQKVSILGFFTQGIQHAVHIINKRPEMFTKLILVSGELYRDYGFPFSLEQRYSIAEWSL